MIGSNNRWRRRNRVGLQSPAAAADEAALAECAKQGSQEAFGQLYARHADDVRAFIHARVHDAALTDDIAAATWLEAWKSVHRFASDGRRFVPWVIGIARYEYLTYVARSLPHQSLDKLADEGRPCLQLADSPRSTEDAAVGRSELRDVVAALKTLPRRRQVALLLQVQEGMSNTDIASTMGTTPTAVRFLLHRGRQQLREALAQGRAAIEVRQ